MPAVRNETPERHGFGLRLREFLAAHPEVTKLEWSRRLGVSPSTIGDMVNKGRLPTGELLLRMIHVFGIDAHWLLTGERTSVSKAQSIEHAYRDGGRAAITEAIRTLTQQRDETWGDEAGVREAVEATLPRKKQRA